MTKDVIHALLLDDDERNHELTAVRFEVGFAKLGTAVEWSFAHTTEKAWAALTQTDAEFDLIVADLLWTKADTPGVQELLGPRLIAEARERFPRAYVLALSNGHPERPHIFSDAQRSGAHRTLRRGELSFESRDHSPDCVAAAINEHILDNGLSSPIPVSYDRDDPAVLDIVHELGEVTLCRLYSRVLEALRCKAEHMRFGYLDPGASGARVCAAEADLADNGVRVHHILKIGRDVHGLEREAERAVEAALIVNPTMFVRPEPGYAVGPVGGWYAIASPLQQSTKTLREWLAAGPRTGAVEDVLGTLFKYAVSDLQRREPLRTASTADLLVTAPFRQARILRAVGRLGPVLGSRQGCGLTRQESDRIVTEIRAFVLDGRLGDVERRRAVQQTPEVHAHRDFHGGNVLVYDGPRPRPVLVDLDGFGPGHWAVDPARLCVDLLLRNVDEGVQSMLFSQFDAWRRLARRVGVLERSEQAVNRTPGTRAALAALTWVTQNLRQACPALGTDEAFARHAWEWNLMLAGYLLRGTYNADTTDPKRALALVAAYDQLKIAERRLGD
ncbi:MAG TPA: phosphotransferase [Actinospica sp.]|nr:phosphotransferase [Actinospica sp.]